MDERDFKKHLARLIVEHQKNHNNPSNWICLGPNDEQEVQKALQWVTKVKPLGNPPP